MPGKHTELPFEDAIVAHLTAHGWLLGTSNHYNKELALYPEDVIAWLQETQPLEWDKVASLHNSGAEQRILDRLAKLIGTNGALAVLRHGFQDVSASFAMCQFAASHTLNPAIQERHNRVRLRVVRQLRYSVNNDNAIDLVLFINGIPVATCELKSDFTQCVDDAIAQYRHDRQPKDPQTKRDEPLLKRALVHFAVSMTEAAMTTALKGKETVFLPFNMGNNGAKGNPPNPDGYATSYLWERIFERSAWLEIIGRFVHADSKPDDAARRQKTIIFPRFHQWDCVVKLVAAARAEGAGQRYLIQHSAGSGKTNSISWLAHHLSDLYDAANRKVFDTIIVITDRNVLDAQLQDAIYQFEHKSGVIASVTGEHDSKSNELAKALEGNQLIVIVTIQTFPFVIQHISASADLKGKKYAVIADEAHSSQSGSVARRLRQTIGMPEGSADDENEIDAEDILAKQAEGGRFPKNISYFAFTATPKGKTIELFGSLPDPTKPPSNENTPQPFHMYTMQQAIEEGFILDVLKNYTPYRVAFKLAHKGQEYDETVDEKSAVKSLIRWVHLHPYNIAQKVQIIVEHFHEYIMWRIDGKAKAMVVTGSRKEAVRYTQAIKAYIREHHYQIGVLAAFSGDVTDENGVPGVFNEYTLNPDIHGQDLREAFQEDAYRIMLVANKFQTGFDQPLLSAMYVDKKLSGITAVQTLSRLNRTYPGKEVTFILDFVNNPDEILAAFQQYYRDAQLGDVSDPNIIHDLQSKLDGAMLYTNDDVAAFASAYVLPTSSQKELAAIITPVAQRIIAEEKRATDTNDTRQKEFLAQFRKDMQSFVRAYEFLAQIVDYGSTDHEKHNIFYRCLLPYINRRTEHDEIDLSKVVMTHFHVHRQETRDLPLAEGASIYPLSEVGSGALHEPEQVYLSEIIQRLNTVFEGELTDADIVSYTTHIRDKMLESEVVRQQARANTQEHLLLSPDFERELQNVIIAAMANHMSMSKQLLGNEEKMAYFRRVIAHMLQQPAQRG